MSREILTALPGGRDYELKKDQTPVTKTDLECQLIARKIVEGAFGDKIFFSGEEEETGKDHLSSISDKDLALFIDPVDGTRAFTRDNSMFSTVAQFYKNGLPYAGLILQPVTMEMAYAIGSQPTRYYRGPRWGVGETWQTMGSRPHSKEELVLNMPVERDEKAVMDEIFVALKAKTIRQFRSTGGSAALPILDVVKGSQVYAGKFPRPTEPHDLGAAIKIVENAGGSIVDLEGKPIAAIGHEGFFVAGLRRDYVMHVCEILSSASSPSL